MIRKFLQSIVLLVMFALLAGLFLKAPVVGTIFVLILFLLVYGCLKAHSS